MYIVNHTHHQLALLPANAEYKLFEVVSHALKTFPGWQLADDVEMYQGGGDYIVNLIMKDSYDVCEY
jgi:hypothetical protein